MIKVIEAKPIETKCTSGCMECQTSCQSACKTSATVANQKCRQEDALDMSDLQEQGE